MLHGADRKAPTRRLCCLLGMISLFGLLAHLAGECAPSQSQEPAVPRLPAVEFVGQWGSQGDQPGQLNDPVGPAIDVAGRVYLASRGKGSVDKFAPNGVPLLSFDYPLLHGTSGIAVDRGGGIYVADLRAGRMQIFFPQGDLLRGFQIVPQRDWQGPFGFSVDAEGRVFVPDPEGGRIRVLDSRGRMERSWEIPVISPDQRRCPAITAAANGFVYAGDACSGSIAKFTPDGQQVTAWGEKPGVPFPLVSLAVSAKYVFVLRDAEPRFEIWTLDGQLQATDNLSGHLNGTTPGKASLAVTSQDELIVLDPAVARVLRFRIHLDPS